MATSRNVVPVEMQKQEQRIPLANDEAFDHSGTSLDNHHQIPRQDFNNYGGGGPKGGDDTDAGKN